MRIDFAGESLELLPQRAVYWSDERALFIADLHLGKPEVFQRHGVPLPATASVDDVARLTELVDAISPKSLWILGDFVHHPDVRDGAAWRAFDGFRRHAADLALHLVLGNHDRGLELPRIWCVDEHDEPHHLGPLKLRHLPDDAAGVLCGHLHPTLTVRGAGDAMRLPCFHLLDGALMLPAFTSFAAGVDVAGAPGEKFVVVDDEVVEI